METASHIMLEISRLREVDFAPLSRPSNLKAEPRPNLGVVKERRSEMGAGRQQYSPRVLNDNEVVRLGMRRGWLVTEGAESCPIRGRELPDS